MNNHFGSNINTNVQKDNLVTPKIKMHYSEQPYNMINRESLENLGCDKKLIALTKIFGNVMDDSDNNMTEKEPVPKLKLFDLDTYKNMSLDTMLNNLNLDKDVLNILKDKINNINRNINVTICSTPMEKQIDKIEKEDINAPNLINCFSEFINWCDNNLIQIKLQLYNIAFCLLLEIYILLLTINYEYIENFKNQYLKKFSAYEPVTKFLLTCVSLTQIFEISLIRFKKKNSKHIVHMTKYVFHFNMYMYI